MGDPIRFHGRFNDGARATSEDVVVEADNDADTATLRAADGRVVAEWPRTAVRLIAPPAGSAPVRLRCGNSDARLMLPAATPHDALLEMFPEASRRDDRRDGIRLVALSVAAVAAVAVIVVLLLPQIAAGTAKLVPAAVAERVGDKTAVQFARLMTPQSDPWPFCEAADGTAVLTGLVDRLTANLASPYPITVRVIPSPIENAAALPGGHILVFEGLLSKMQDPAGFVGVLAHEIGHVVERHPLTAAIEGAGITLLAGVVFGDITGGGTVGAISQALAGAAYRREDEAAADDIAVRLLNQADIRGDGLAAFLDRAASMEPSESLAFTIFSTHPASHERADRVRQATTGAGPGLTPADWQALKTICVDR